MKPAPAAASLLVCLPLAILAQTGRLSGKVTDFCDGRGLFGVKVHIDKADGLPVPGYKDIVTEFDGTYVVNGLTPKIEYRATFSLTDYSPDIRPVTVTSQYSPELSKYYAPPECLQKAAARTVLSIRSQPSESQAAMLTAEWEKLRNRLMSASGKARFAHALQSSLPAELWSDLPSFRVYAEADPENLRTVEAAFARNYDGINLANLNPTLSEDIKTTQQKYRLAAGGKQFQ